MADIGFYERVMGLGSVDAIVQDFLHTVALTNRGYAYFVDWDKVRDNVNAHRVEFSILNSLTGVTNVSQAENQFEELVKRYPEVIPVLPILIACRETELDILPDLHDTVGSTLHVCFSPDVLQQPAEFQNLLAFCRRVRLFELFADEQIHDLVEYVYGVEVGMDTNARKNRSGKAMESAVGPAVEAAAQAVGNVSVIPQCTNKKLAAAGYGCPIGRRMDFVVIKHGAIDVFCNIETNYFGTTGSKPDIVTGYIQRQRALAEEGWHFVLVTDGSPWAGMHSLLVEAITGLDYVFNLRGLRQGALGALIDSW